MSSSSEADFVITRIRVYLGALRNTDDEEDNTDEEEYRRPNLPAKRRCIIDLIRDELKDLEKITKELEKNQKGSPWHRSK